MNSSFQSISIGSGVNLTSSGNNLFNNNILLPNSGYVENKVNTVKNNPFWVYDGLQNTVNQATYPKAVCPINSARFDSIVGMEYGISFALFYFNTGMLVNTFSVSMDNTAASTGMCGFYTMHPVTKLPDVLVPNSSGLFGLISPGIKTVSYSPAVSLSSGYYWAAITRTDFGGTPPTLLATSTHSLSVYQSLFGSEEFPIQYRGSRGAPFIYSVTTIPSSFSGYTNNDWNFGQGGGNTMSCVVPFIVLR